MSLPIYSTGTVSVAAGGTTVTGAGVMWTGVNVKQGDFISINGSAAVLITEATDAANLQIAPWQGAAQSNVPYVIYQNYVGRVVGVAAAEDVGVMLEKLHTDGLPFIVGADETVPDPSYGDEGQLAFKPSTGEWWVKQGGVWVHSSGLTALGYGGTSATPMLIGLSPPTKAFTTQSSLAYNGARVRAASAANLNNWMEGVAAYSGTTLTMTCDLANNSGTYSDWLFSIAGTKGATGNTGPQGVKGDTGPPGATGSGAGNVTGPASSVDNRIAVFNGPTGTVIKDGGKTIAELGAGTIIVGDIPPAGAPTGTLWWESDTGNLYIKYNDGDSTQWVMAVPAPSASTLSAVTYAPQTLTASQQTIARQNIFAAPFDAMSYSGLQINGSMEVSQELGTTGTTAFTKYICDGWVLGGSLSSGGSVSAQQAGAGAALLQYGFANNLFLTVGTAQSLLTIDAVQPVQRIEGYRIARLAWGTANAQPITIGFWTAHHRTGMYTVGIRNGAADRSYIATYTQAAADVWQYNVVTIPGDVGGTWLLTNGIGIILTFCMASGPSNVAPSANAWVAGNYSTVAGIASSIATTDMFRITGVVVLPGIEAPSAARSALIMRPYDQELVTCQRYFQKNYPIATNPGTAISAGTGGEYWSASDGNFAASRNFAPRMRPSPTLNIWDHGGNANFVGYFNGSVWTAGGAISVKNITDAGLILYSGIAGAKQINFYWTADARL